jgi:hypothetical protein
VNLYSYVNNNPLNWVDPFGLCKDKSFSEKFGEGYYFGTGYGQEALDWWATKWVETGNPLYAVGGGFAALWTPEAWWKTAAVLGGAYAISGWASQTGPWMGKVVVHGPHAGGPHQYRHLQIMIRTGKHITKHIRIRLGF